MDAAERFANADTGRARASSSRLAFSDHRGELPEFCLRNSGSVAAQGVEIHDELPKGTQLVSTTPRRNAWK